MTQPTNEQAAASTDAYSAASAGRLWSDWDVRGQAAVESYVKRVLGVPRPRSMTVTFPLAGTTPPPVGFLTSFAIFQRVRVAGWLILAHVPGQISVDLLVSNVQASPDVLPTQASIIGPTPISMSGYSVASYDTSAWVGRDLPAPSVLTVMVIAAASIQQATLGLQLVDLQGRTLQI